MTDAVDTPVATVGRSIRIMREARRFTQAALAKTIGIDENALRLIERDARQPTLDDLRTIAETLDTTPGRLLDGPDIGRVPDLDGLDGDEAAMLEALHALLSRRAAKGRGERS